MTRTTSVMVEEKIQQWRQANRERGRQPKRVLPRPVVSVSREAGAGGEEVARIAAKQLDLTVWDNELVHEVALRADARDALIESFDEHVQGRITEFISLFVLPSATNDEYVRDLTTVVHGLERTGGAMVIGRGCEFLLQSKRALRLRVVCPEATRVERYQRKHGIESEAEAKKTLSKIEHERETFVKRTFHDSITNPVLYDLTINTGELTPKAAADVICAAYKAKFSEG